MTNVNSWDKFVLLLWKNWRLQRTRKIGLVLELLLPVIFSLLIVFIRLLVDSESKPATNYSPVNIESLSLFYKSFYMARFVKKFTTRSGNLSPAYMNFTRNVVYTPENPALNTLVSTAVSPMGLTAVGVNDLAALEDKYQRESFFAGIVFDASLKDITDFQNIKSFDFTLRFPSELRTSLSKYQVTWSTNRLFPLFEQVGPRNPNDADGGIPPGYLREGFLPLQNALTRTYLQMASGEQSLPEVEMQRYPYPPYISDPLLEGLADLLAFLILISFIHPCVNVTRGVAQEKEQQLKEVMKIMGLDNWLHWLAWFVKSLFFFVISAFFMTLLLMIRFKGGVAVLTYSDPTLVFVFLLFYVTTLIFFCFLISTWFSKASTAAAVTGLLMFISYVPYAFLANDYGSLTLGSKLGWSLLVNTAMGFGLKVIFQYEGTGEGMQWRNLFTPANIDDELTLGYVMLMMVASWIIYMLITLYIEQISPGEYGIPRKWYFPFTSEFWCLKKRFSGVDDMPRNGISRNNDAFEAEPVGKHVGVQVLNLRKEFGEKVAVKGVSLNMYEDEITVLLGHNGAGKTTTISMLTGLFPPTSGTAIINGSDIRTNVKGARMSLGICPQHNVLFDDMTVADHIVFFSRLKGLKGRAVQMEVDKYLKTIELDNKANAASKTLSGGMKRKLSLCCALCGGTKVVLCDEPSSGLDPSARRQLWNLLQSEKNGRTLLLTTHFMDEADVLGDRIVIMCDGEVKCSGSSFFLKKKYGSGYRLVCVKEPECNPTNVTELLSKYIPGIVPEANIGAELSYNLADEYSTIFEKMFADLESRSKELHISGYGVSITSMEEVFMKVGSENAPDGSRQNQNEIMKGGTGYNDEVESTTSDNLFSGRSHLVQGYYLILYQWKGMFLKKFLYTKRNWLIFLIQLIMPIFFIVMSIVIARNSGGFNALRALPINLQQYPTANIVSDTSESPPENSISAEVMKQYNAIGNSLSSKYEFATTGTKSFNDYILNLGEDYQGRVNTRYLAAASFKDGIITAWLNNQPLHTAPLTVNMVYNAMAKAVLGNPDAEIKVTNWPLPYTADTLMKQIASGNNIGSQIATNLCFCMCFVSSFYVLFLIKERESRAKLLQFVGGVRVWTFWLTQLIYDYATFIIISVLVIVTLACFQEEGLSSFDELGRIFLLLLVFGYSSLPFIYLLSFLFKEPAAGFGRVSFLNLLTGLALFIVILVMSMPFYNTKPVADVLKWFFMIFPHFSLAMGINKLYSNNAIKKNCDLINKLPINVCKLYPQCCPTTPYLAWRDPGVLPEIIFLLVTGTIFFSILIIKEFGLVSELIYYIKKKSISPPVEHAPGYLDDDVQKEMERVREMSNDEKAGQNLVLDRVTKYYGDFPAVNQISLCVQSMECFGLLGVNGAGKTTTFKMMTGDERLTFGEAFVCGINLKTDITSVYKEIGYCPQFDALLDDLTGREMLKLFCLLRGVHALNIDSISEDLAKSFGFMKHIEKRTKNYSGGNKRKLSAAIACIGNPSVIYMDEPTSGIDPAARRQLWNMLCRLRDSGKSIVLTSHSMEECEALCTRLAIMVNGEFKCMGSTQHLKNKFSKGLVLKIKIKRNPDSVRLSYILSPSKDDVTIPMQLLQQDVDNIQSFIGEHFPNAVLKEQYQGILTFYIPLTDIKWSIIFGIMEKHRDELNIEDYSVSQTTLEEVFLDFASAQKEDTRILK